MTPDQTAAPLFFLVVGDYGPYDGGIDILFVTHTLQEANAYAHAHTDRFDHMSLADFIILEYRVNTPLNEHHAVLRYDGTRWKEDYRA